MPTLRHAEGQGRPHRRARGAQRGEPGTVDHLRQLHLRRGGQPHVGHRRRGACRALRVRRRAPAHDRHRPHRPHLPLPLRSRGPLRRDLGRLPRQARSEPRGGPTQEARRRHDEGEGRPTRAARFHAGLVQRGRRLHPGPVLLRQPSRHPRQVDRGARRHHGHVPRRWPHDGHHRRGGGHDPLRARSARPDHPIRPIRSVA